ncbi:MAG: flagellar basal body rod C-terminal domain-containing protein [Pseudomonadota bacterium]
MINAISTAISGLLASSKRVEASASNIANISTSGALDSSDGPAPYQAQTTLQQAVTDTNGNGLGVRANTVPKDPGFVEAFDPNSPFANEDGVIGVPNVNLAEEAVNLKLAELTYKANIKVLSVADELSDELIQSLNKKV